MEDRMKATVARSVGSDEQILFFIDIVHAEYSMYNDKDIPSVVSMCGEGRGENSEVHGR